MVLRGSSFSHRVSVMLWLFSFTPGGYNKHFFLLGDTFWSLCTISSMFAPSVLSSIFFLEAYHSEGVGEAWAWVGMLSFKLAALSGAFHLTYH